MRVGSLFSGIGGIDLGLERAGMKIAWQVEIDEWCRRVLTKHWPAVPKYGDIRSVGAHNLAAVDVLAGGFPCQPVSHAGKRQAQDDARWLWPEFARLVRELRPRYVFVENVPGLLDGPMADVLGDLAACGYDAEWDCIPAAAVGALHTRDRVWMVAYADSGGGSAESRQQQAQRPQVFVGGSTAHVSDAGGEGLEGLGRLQKVSCALTDGFDSDSTTGFSVIGDGGFWSSEPQLGRMAHGIPHRVDRLRGLGNAVVPQIVQWIGERMMAAERSKLK